MDQHAALWPELTTFHGRYVEFPEDVTVATHPALGVCVIWHFGWDDEVTWMSPEPISDELAA